MKHLLLSMLVVGVIVLVFMASQSAFNSQVEQMVPKIASAHAATLIPTSTQADVKETTAQSYEQVAREDAIASGIDPDLFVRQINEESGFSPTAVSRAGAIGIAQIEPATARGWGVDPTDPVASLKAAAVAMHSYLSRYGSWAKALGCYNAGCGAVDYAVQVGGAQWMQYLPAETQNYINIILG